MLFAIFNWFALIIYDNLFAECGMDHVPAFFTSSHFRYNNAGVPEYADLYLSEVADIQNIINSFSEIIPLYAICGLPWMDFRSGDCQHNRFTRAS
jgi:hypothetical protein